MDIGYARVSTGEQTLDLQLDALTSAGCGKIYSETASGAKADRPILDEVLSYLRPGDTLVVWRLDRLGRSLQYLIEVVAGLAAARARGRLGGRPRKLRDAKQLDLARALYDGGQTDIATICATLGISRATLYRYLKDRDGDPAQGPGR